MLLQHCLTFKIILNDLWDYSLKTLHTRNTNFLTLKTSFKRLPTSKHQGKRCPLKKHFPYILFTLHTRKTIINISKYILNPFIKRSIFTIHNYKISFVAFMFLYLRSLFLHIVFMWTFYPFNYVVFLSPWFVYFSSHCLCINLFIPSFMLTFYPFT